MSRYACLRETQQVTQLDVPFPPLNHSFPFPRSQHVTVGQLPLVPTSHPAGFHTQLLPAVCEMWTLCSSCFICLCVAHAYTWQLR